MVTGRRVTTVAALAGAAVALAGCGGSSPAGAGGPQSLTVSLTDAGCSPASLQAKSGAVTFNVVNGGTGKVTELELKNSDGIILGERENIVAGIKGSFTLNLQPGDYVLSCPNGDEDDNGKLAVSGTATSTGAVAVDPLLNNATALYSAYVARQSTDLLARTRLFVAALRAGKLERAKSLFGSTRFKYETIEPVAESFGDLDPSIDARANDVESPATWTGFHRIEQILWEQGSTKGTEPYAARLLSDVETLNRRVRTLSFQPAQLANGAVALLNEVANSKITGEEDRYSHTDLSDFAANLAGAEVAFQLLRPALEKRGEKALAVRIAGAFAAVQYRLDTYTRSTPLGFAYYGELTPADRQRLAQGIGDLAEPLAMVAAKVSD